jgi:glycosyltransferase involved in cell wall biosynthesis
MQALTNQRNRHVTHELEDSPLVSVIMPARNAALTLPATLRSLERQTYEHWELLITDDGSTDETTQTVHHWAASIPQRTTVLKASGVGPSAARNLAADGAQGSLIAFLDADDIWHAEKLAEQVQALISDPHLVGVTCDYAIVDGPSGQIRKHITFDWSDKSFDRWIVMEGVGPALCSTLLVRATQFHEVGGFDPDLWNLEDVDLALRLLAPRSIGFVPSTLCDYIIQQHQNHQQMTTVATAVRILISKPPFSNDHRLARRLQTNLHLLETLRSFRRRRSPRQLGELLRVWLHAPITVTRTIIRTATR